MLHYIIYQSTPTGEVTEETIENITSESKKWNAQNGITGILIYHDGAYIQYIEGKEEAVLEVFDKISQDTRHQQVTTNVMGYTNERIFPDWSMGSWMISDGESNNLKVLADLNHYLSDPLNKQLTSAKYIGMMKEILEMWTKQSRE